MAESTNTIDRGHSPALLWWVMWAGPLAWAADEGFSYVLAQHSCSTGHSYVLHAITAICFVIALTGAAGAHRAYHRLPHDASDKGPTPLDRGYFQILFGAVFSLAFAVVIIALAVPRWILSPCD